MKPNTYYQGFIGSRYKWTQLSRIFYSDTQPINLIRDAPNRGEVAHSDGAQVEYICPGVSVSELGVWQSVSRCPPTTTTTAQTSGNCLFQTRQRCAHARSSVRNRFACVKTIAPFQFAQKVTARSCLYPVIIIKHGLWISCDRYTDQYKDQSVYTTVIKVKFPHASKHIEARASGQVLHLSERGLPVRNPVLMGTRAPPWCVWSPVISHEAARTTFRRTENPVKKKRRDLANTRGVSIRRENTLQNSELPENNYRKAQIDIEVYPHVMWFQFMTRNFCWRMRSSEAKERAQAARQREETQFPNIKRRGNWVWSPVGLTAVRMTTIMHDPSDTHVRVRLRLDLPLVVGSRCDGLKFLPSVARAARQQVTKLREREKDKRWKRLSFSPPPPSLSLSPSLSLTLISLIQ